MEQGHNVARVVSIAGVQVHVGASKTIADSLDETGDVSACIAADGAKGSFVRGDRPARTGNTRSTTALRKNTETLAEGISDIRHHSGRRHRSGDDGRGGRGRSGLVGQRGVRTGRSHNGRRGRSRRRNRAGRLRNGRNCILGARRGEKRRKGSIRDRGDGEVFDGLAPAKLNGGTRIELVVAVELERLITALTAGAKADTTATPEAVGRGTDRRGCRKYRRSWRRGSGARGRRIVGTADGYFLQSGKRCRRVGHGSGVSGQTRRRRTTRRTGGRRGTRRRGSRRLRKRRQVVRVVELGDGKRRIARTEG